MGVKEWNGVGDTLGEKTEGMREGTNLSGLSSAHRRELQTISGSQTRPSHVTEGWWSRNLRHKPPKPPLLSCCKRAK